MRFVYVAANVMAEIVHFFSVFQFQSTIMGLSLIIRLKSAITAGSGKRKLNRNFFLP